MHSFPQLSTLYDDCNTVIVDKSSSLIPRGVEYSPNLSDSQDVWFGDLNLCHLLASLPCLLHLLLCRSWDNEKMVKLAKDFNIFIMSLAEMMEMIAQWQLPKDAQTRGGREWFFGSRMTQPIPESWKLEFKIAFQTIGNWNVLFLGINGNENSIKKSSFPDHFVNIFFRCE